MVQDGPLDVPARSMNPRFILHSVRLPSIRFVLSLIGRPSQHHYLYCFHRWSRGQRWRWLFRQAIWPPCDDRFSHGNQWWNDSVHWFSASGSGGGHRHCCHYLGISVVADSAQFPTALSELCEEAYRGTCLNCQTGLGFLITVVPIWLVPVLSDSVVWGLAFALLGAGPALGIAAMLRLRSMPNSIFGQGQALISNPAVMGFGLTGTFHGNLLSQRDNLGWVKSRQIGHKNHRPTPRTTGAT